MTTQENQSKGEKKCECGHSLKAHPYIPRFGSIEGHNGGCNICQCRQYTEATPPHSEVEGDWRDGFDKIWFNKKYIDSNGRTIKTDLYFALLAYFSHLLVEREKREIEFLEKLNSAADTVTCDCGEPYKDSVLADLIYERISQLTPKDDKCSFVSYPQ